MNKLSLKELENYIKEILECNAFELHSDNHSYTETDNPNSYSNYYIPYMMNDALECYILLKNCRMTGKFLADIKEKMHIECISNAIIFHQGTENVFTLWFEETFLILKCFRYDRIGHFWVNGAEHWRRLVYIIGTMYDKYEYMGNQVCNKKEMALLPLMEFAPFRMYSPIHESLDQYYMESKDSLKCISALARQVKDRKFLALLKLYAIIPSHIMKNVLFHALNHPNRQKLYELIFYKVQEASMEYPERSYHPALNIEIENARKQVTQQLHQAGFHGSYPLFHKENQQILAMEEHPFTILEAKDFSFRIQFMFSEVSKDKEIPQALPLNIGFFHKKNYRCRIISDPTQLL